MEFAYECVTLSDQIVKDGTIESAGRLMVDGLQHVFELAMDPRSVRSVDQVHEYRICHGSPLHRTLTTSRAPHIEC